MIKKINIDAYFLRVKIVAIALVSVFSLKAQFDSTVSFIDDPIVAALDSLHRSALYNAEANHFDYLYNGAGEVSDTAVSFAPEVYAERLAILDSETPFDLRYNSTVQSFIDLYAVRRRSTVANVMGLSRYYFPLFEPILAKYEVPLELKYLAICESALNPIARSRASAAGLWQFMYPTGKMFGLNVNSYVDERHDAFKATEAACKYFVYLYKMYNNWELVLAAYNAGPGNVNKAIRRSGGKQTYWEVRPYLPRETRGYVPGFIAVNYIMNYAKEHNISSVEPMISFSQTDTVVVRQQLSFHQISKVIDVKEDVLEMLNPSYSRNVIPVMRGLNSVLVLPSEKIGVFIQNEDSIYKQAATIPTPVVKIPPKPAVRIYKVRSGDNLGAIAQRYGCTVSELKRWNNKRSSRINIGERLKIYSNRTVSSRGTARTYNSGGYKYYTVRSGDNLSVIASRYGTSVSKLKALNNLSSSKLKPGQKLKIKKI